MAAHEYGLLQGSVEPTMIGGRNRGVDTSIQGSHGGNTFQMRSRSFVYSQDSDQIGGGKMPPATLGAHHKVLTGSSISQKKSSYQMLGRFDRPGSNLIEQYPLNSLKKE